ncbi:hypothetical protein DRE_00701 [Drechslerella stenobrocha 248]|uniref:Uncharacterized protein n=1 Tax=Drechslerella stenobrocha 248 TaxID=1043628 RepID=W7HYP0_9PEZI|nr:hypothetical protein DRE_00701 [Drechslerella stenobrocha 248]
MLEEPSVMAKRPIPAAPQLQPTVPKFASLAGSCCFMSIKIVNSKHIKDRCNCRSFIQQPWLGDQDFSSSWSSVDRYFCSCGHHAQYHPPKKNGANINCHPASECSMDGPPLPQPPPPPQQQQQQQQQEHHEKQEAREEEMYIHIPPRPVTPIPAQEAENNRHIWHLYQKTAKLEQQISQNPTAEGVKTVVGSIVGKLEERVSELEELVEVTELRLEESERRAKSLQEEIDDLADENDDLRQGLSPSIERAGSDELEKLWHEESGRRQDAEKSLREALSALKPISKQNPWRVYVKLVLDPDQKAPATADSHEHARCEVLGCYQHVQVEGSGSRHFQQSLALTFPASLLSNRWVPLIASEGEDGQVELERASDVESFPSLWSVDFLRNTCAVSIDGQDELYIAPQSSALVLEELESPPESPGLTEASTISSTSVLRRSTRKRSITNSNKMDMPVVTKRVRVKS